MVPCAIFSFHFFLNGNNRIIISTSDDFRFCGRLFSNIQGTHYADDTYLAFCIIFGNSSRLNFLAFSRRCCLCHGCLLFLNCLRRRRNYRLKECQDICFWGKAGRIIIVQRNRNTSSCCICFQSCCINTSCIAEYNSTTHTGSGYFNKLSFHSLPPNYEILC